jgi:hypothetical protein
LGMRFWEKGTPQDFQRYAGVFYPRIVSIEWIVRMRNGK